MRRKDHSDKVRQRADGHRDNQVRSTQDRTDQCVLIPLLIRGHAHREDVQKHRVSLQQQNTSESSQETSTLSLGLG